MKLRFILKSGVDFVVSCEDASITRNNITDTMMGYNLVGIKVNKPLFINFNEVAAVIRLGELQDEEGK